MEAPQSSTALMTRRERREANQAALLAAGATTPAGPGPAPQLPDAGPAAVPQQSAPLTRRERREAAQRVNAPVATPTPGLGNHVVPADIDPWETAVRVLPAVGPSVSVSVPPAARTVRRPAPASVPPARAVVPASVPVPVVAAPGVAGPACAEHAPHLPVTPAAATAPADATESWGQPHAPHAAISTGAGAPAAGAGAPPAAVAPAPAPLRPAERTRWVPRVAVLTSLAVATIAVPLTGAARGTAADGGVGSGPSLLDAVSASPASAAPPASIKALAAAPDRDDAASRSQARSGLASCDGTAYVRGKNGLLDTGKLCELWQKGYYLQPLAAQALSALNDAFTVRFGTQLCLVAAYRPLATQYELATTRAGYAAVPGTSDHGLGVAIDLCSSMTGNAEFYQWIRANAPVYGWDNPPWARPGGVGAYEPWHFEYYAGVKALGGQI